jgi:hypothetical protein
LAIFDTFTRNFQNFQEKKSEAIFFESQQINSTPNFDSLATQTGNSEIPKVDFWCQHPPKNIQNQNFNSLTFILWSNSLIFLILSMLDIKLKKSFIGIMVKAGGMTQNYVPQWQQRSVTDGNPANLCFSRHETNIFHILHHLRKV